MVPFSEALSLINFTALTEGAIQALHLRKEFMIIFWFSGFLVFCKNCLENQKIIFLDSPAMQCK